MSINKGSLKSMPLLAMVLVLAGCSLAPKHERPMPPVAANWPETIVNHSGTDASMLGWSSFIEDEQLRQLVGMAVNNNRSLRQALLDIEAARAQYRITGSARLPAVSAQADGTRQRLPADLSMTGRSEVQSSYQVGLGLTAFELDLFGRATLKQLRRQTRSHLLEHERFIAGLLLDAGGQTLDYQQLQRVSRHDQRARTALHFNPRAFKQALDFLVFQL